MFYIIANDEFSLEDDLSMTSVPGIILSSTLSSSIIHQKSLPLNYAGIMHCFNKSKPILPNEIKLPSQTTQISLSSFCDETQADDLLTAHSSVIIEFYKSLGFYFKMIEVPSEELQPYAYREIEFEAWIPSIKEYCQTANTIHCSNYPATRFNSLYTDPHNKRKPLTMIHSVICNIEKVMLQIFEYYKKEKGL